MKDISRGTEGGMEMWLSAKLSAESTDTTNCISNCKRRSSDGYTKKVQFFDETSITEIPALDVTRRQKMAQVKSSLHIERNISNQDMKDELQALGNTMRKNKKNTFDSRASEIDWNFLSKNLMQNWSGLELTKGPSASLELVAQSTRNYSGQEQVTQGMSLPNMEEENHCRHYTCNSDLRNEDLIVGGFTGDIRLNYGGNHGLEGVLGFSEAKYLHGTSLDSDSGRLHDQASVFTSPVGGQISGKGREVTKNPNYFRICSSNNVANLQKSCGARCAEGDYLFSDTLVQKKRFRLLIDAEKEILLRAENYYSCWSLSDIIAMKYRSLGIPVEVKAYQRQDKDKTDSKAFNITFKNSKDISYAFSMGKKGRLFPILEARPSPTNHVRYEVMQPTGVFEGKCFRRQQIQQLQKGDVVTANQLKGNRVRIIKWCPGGCKMNLDLQGWVLVNTKDVDLLRRIYWWEAEESVVNKYPIPEARPSPTNHVRYEVMQPTGVFEGNCFHNQQIQQLRKGDVVTANQLKGNRVRIIKWCPGGCKTNLDLQGWVLVNTKDMDLLRRIYWWESEKSVVNKDRRSTSANSLAQHPKISRNLQRTVQKHMFNKCNPQRVSPGNCCPFKVLVEVEVRKGRKEPAIVGRLKPGDIVWANQHKGSMLRIIKQHPPLDGSTLKSEVWGWVCLQRRYEEKPRLIRILNLVIAKTRGTGKIKFPPQKAISTRSQPRESRDRLTSDTSTPQYRHFLKSKNTLKFKEDKVLIASSPYSKIQVTPRQRQGEKFFPEISERNEPSALEMSIPNNFWGMGGKVKPCLNLSIPFSMSYSRSASPMSISS